MKTNNSKDRIANTLLLAILFLSLMTFLVTNVFGQTTKRIFMIGNSVTDGINYFGFKSIAESKGNTHIWARHMIPGSPLFLLWAARDGSSGFFEEPYGPENNAFPNYQWDAITLQPFDRMLVNGDDQGDVINCSNYANLAKGKSPNVQFYILGRYPRTPNDLAPTNASLTADTWNTLHLRTFTDDWDGTNETRDYYQQLTDACTNANPSVKKFLMIPVGEVMYSLNNKMKAGQVPGYTKIWQVYADGIHVNNIGSYIIACTFYATIYKDSPVGTAVPTEYGSINSSLASIIQQTVWEVVSTYSYSGIAGSSTVAVTGVSVSPSSTSLTVNQTLQLNATIAPSNATNQSVTWTSSNTSIATVSTTGLVTGKAAGNATITCKTADGNKTATCAVTVTSGSIVVTGVSVSPTTTSIKVGNSSTLSATVAPSNATNTSVTWTSSNTAIATVDANGKVTAIAAGSATITVKTVDQNKTATCAVTIVANAAPTAVITANPISGTAPLVVAFNSSASTDPDAGDFILGFEWDFGDGSAIDHSTAPSHTYTSAGTYTVKFRVMDNNNLYSSQVTKDITVTGGTSTIALSSWDFAAKGGQSSVASKANAAGITVSNADLATGLTAIDYLSNGLTAMDQTTTTLADAITGNEYITFTVTPLSGKSVSIKSIQIRPVSQNVIRTFSIFSSINGFSVANEIGNFTSSSELGALLQTINISGHDNLTSAVTFRIYTYGATNNYESVGIGNRSSSLSEDDLIINGTVQNAADTQAPTSPSALASSAITQTTFTLLWTAATDNVGVTSYEVFKNGTSIGTTTATTINISGLTASTSYSMTVKAIDAAANLSVASAALNVTTSAVVLTGSAISSWDFAAKGGQASVAPKASATGITVSNADIASGLTALNFLSNGLTAMDQTTTTLADAITGNEYITFTVTPVSGKSVSIKSIQIRPVSQNVVRTFSIFSSINGFAVANEIGNFTSSSGMNALLQTINISGHDNLTSAVTFRIYTYGATNNYESVGIGNRSGSLIEDDLIINGTVQNAADTQAPTAPTVLTTSAITTTSLTLSWSASTDNVGVVSYEVFNGTTSLGTTTSTSIAITGLTCNTTYNLNVKAKDAAGNISVASAIKTQATAACPDTQAPSAPTALKFSALNNTSFTLSWTASTDNVGVASYEIFAGTTSKGTTASTSLSIQGLTANTRYTMTIKAKDAAGNVSVASTSLAVKTLTAPNIALNKTANASTTATTYIASQAFDGSTSTQWRSISETNPWIYIDLGANYSISRVYLSWNTYYGTAYQIQTSNDASTWTTIKTLSGQNGGVDDNTGLTGTGRYVRIYVNTRNNTSNGVRIVEMQVYGTSSLDTQAPSAPSALVSSAITQNSFTLSWTASTDNIGVASYEVFANSVSKGTTTSASIGITSLTASTTYTMTVKAKDAAGNISAASAALNVTTSVASTGAPAGYTYVCDEGGTVTVSGTMDIAYGANGTFYYKYNQTTNCGCISSDFGGDPVPMVEKACYTKASLADTQAPSVPTALVSSAIAQTSFTLTWTASTDNIGIASYEVFAGATSKGTTTSTSKNVTGLVCNTSNAMTVKAKDAAGNVSAASSILNVKTSACSAADTQAPSVPTALTSSAITSSSFSLSWTGSTDNVGVSSYDVFSNGSLKINVTSTSASITGLSASTTYTMTVKAKDAAGNVSAVSTAKTVTTIAGTSGTPKLPIGMNIPGLTYYSNCLIFTDAMTAAGEMMTSYEGGPFNSEKMSEIPRDVNGYPTKLPYTTSDGKSSFVFMMINNYYSGRYVMTFDGLGTIDIFGGTFTKVNNNKYYIDFNGTGSDMALKLMTSTNGNHLRNFKIIPQAYDGIAYPTFNPEFIEGLRPFHALRFMDWICTNNSTQSAWSDRITKTYYTQASEKGASYEYAIELANELNADAWVTVPHKADDNFIIQTARLWRDGLEANLKVYCEYSNEIWNWQFYQAGYVVQNAPGHPNSYVSSDLAAISAEGNHPEKDAYMMARNFRLWKAEFTGVNATRLVRVAGVQHGWMDNTRRILNYLFDVNGGGCDVVSPGGYFNFQESDHNGWLARCGTANPVTPAQILDAVSIDYDSNEALWTDETALYANQRGVGYVVYEGGQHMQAYMQGDWCYNQAVYDAQIHPKMYDMYMKNFRKMTEPEVNCSLFMAFSYLGARESKYGSWGHLENLNQVGASNMMTIAPKYQALLDANTPKTKNSMNNPNSNSANMNTNNESSVSIYPNPATDYITIELMNVVDNDKTNITLTDLTGKVVYTNEVSQISRLTLNTNSFSKGMYILNVKTGSKNFINKLIIK